jgi:tetratricopeptide (TPR) repeat protein
MRILSLALGLSLTACSGGHSFLQGHTKAIGGDGAAFDAAVAAGDAAWSARVDRAKLSEAIQHWETAVGQKEDAATLTKIARAHYFLGDSFRRFEGDGSGMFASFEVGMKFAERALFYGSPAFQAKMKETSNSIADSIEVIGEGSMPAAYWYASNLGKWAKGKGFAVLLGNKGTIEAVMKRCEKIDPTGSFYHGGVLRYWGTFYAVAPGFAGGDLDKSRVYFKKAVAASPYNMATKVLWAENLSFKQDKREEFDALLAEVLAFDIEAFAVSNPEAHADLGAELVREKEKARHLQAKADDIF